MNPTSFGERGGSAALVDAGSVRVGWPGAPGCTMAGDIFESACCARTENVDKHVRAQKARNALRDAATLITDRKLGLKLRGNNCIGFKASIIEINLSQMA
jgi:hypothetical protein